MSQTAEPRNRELRSRVARGIVFCTGLALTVAAAMADQAWFDRHFLPVLFLSPEGFVLGEQLARAFVGVAGIVLMTAGARIAGRAARRRTAGEWAADTGGIALALLLALFVSEGLLRLAPFRASEEDPAHQEPLRRRDPALGWVFVPSRSARIEMEGKAVDYAFDAHGYRVRSPSDPVDPAKPTILFAGESIMMGYGLPWNESIPARVGARLGLQSANLGVLGYADDQTFRRLATELPRFSRPAGVVVLFMPGLLFRDFNKDRPYLGPGMVPRPAVKSWRLAQLLRFYVPYHSSEEIERTLALVRAELEAEVHLARERGAVPLIVVPHYGPDSPFERMVRRRLLDTPGLPYAWIRLDEGWRLPDGVHPDARGAAAIADAVVRRLRAAGITVAR